LFQAKQPGQRCLNACTLNLRNHLCKTSLKPDVRPQEAKAHSAISRWKHRATAVSQSVFGFKPVCPDRPAPRGDETGCSSASKFQARRPGSTRATHPQTDISAAVGFSSQASRFDQDTVAVKVATRFEVVSSQRRRCKPAATTWPVRPVLRSDPAPPGSEVSSRAALARPEHRASQVPHAFCNRHFKPAPSPASP
jgi:hypothetical protein